MIKLTRSTRESNIRLAIRGTGLDIVTQPSTSSVAKISRDTHFTTGSWLVACSNTSVFLRGFYQNLEPGLHQGAVLLCKRVTVHEGGIGVRYYSSLGDFAV